MPYSTFNLSSLDGTNGFVINGIDEWDKSGTSVSSAGDINADGIDDLIIGADGAAHNGKYRVGESYVVFGSNSTFNSSLDRFSLDGINGFVINGIDEWDKSGTSVSSAGDINADGIDDLIIGASDADPNGKSYAGESYVVFGSDSTFNSSLDLSSLDGTNGFVINGIDEWDKSGTSVSGAGDINADGIDDLIIGADGADPDGNNGAGESYVVFGSDSTFNSSLDLSSLDGTSGFVINGIDKWDNSGGSVSSAGDINADGIDDLIIGAFIGDPNGKSYAGESYVVFGSDSTFNSSLDLSSLDGTNGFVINGIDSEQESGSSVSSAGDVNADGIDDFIISAKYATPDGKNGAGESYVVFGSDSTFNSSLDLSSLDGTNGFVINGIDSEDNSGTSVSGAGDVNADGIDDLIIGASGADPNGEYRAGESYVVFGSNSTFNSSLDLSSLDGTNGFVINGIDERDCSGSSVSDAGDINADGIDDFIIGAKYADTDGKNGAGESYVIFSSEIPAYPLIGTNDADTIVGGTRNDSLFGKDGSDYLAGSSGNDTLNGGEGKDTLDGNNGNDFLLGANDADTLFGSNGHDYLYGGKSYDYLLGGVGSDTLVGSDGHDTLLGDERSYLSQGEDYLFGGKGDDILKGWKGDDSLFGGQGRDILKGEADNDSLNGGEGNDFLLGGYGNDYLNGKEDNDILRGSGGDDTLEGGAGRDILFGNAGQDTFVLPTDMETAARDAIRDFELDTDLLGVSDLAEIDDLNIVNDGRNSSSIILGNNGQQIALLFGKPNLTLDDLDFVEI